MTLLDKGFFGTDLLLRIQAEDTNRHWLIPERKGQVYTELERYGDGDRLLQNDGLASGIKKTWRRRHTGKFAQ